MLEPCALSFTRLVLCWNVVFGSRHSCLEFRFHVGVWTLTLHVLSYCGSVRSRVHLPVLSYPRVLCCFTQFMFFIGCLHSCYVLCCVAHSLCFALAVFIVVIVFLFVCLVIVFIIINVYFTSFYVKHFELPLCMKCAI